MSPNTRSESADEKRTSRGCCDAASAFFLSLGFLGAPLHRRALLETIFLNSATGSIFVYCYIAKYPPSTAWRRYF